jgi:hypothetical protein
MSTIDWSKAPEGYDFHFQGKAADPYGKFYTATSDRFVSEVGSYILYRDLAELFIVNHRPEQVVQWSGEGRPPVGIECEFQHRNAPNGIWHPTTIRFSSHAHIIYVDSIENCEACYAVNDSCGIDFRPVRTQEQIALDERDKASVELAGILSGHDQHIAVRDIEMAKYLYDMG